MSKLSDKLIRVPEVVDRKITKIQSKLQRARNSKVPRHEAIETAVDFYLMEAGK